MIDRMQYKLGRKAVKLHPARLAAADRLVSKLPLPPPAVDWSNGRRDWGVMLNHQLNDCTIAGVAHAVQVVEDNAGASSSEASGYNLSDDVILQYYEKWDGYNPALPGTDDGGIAEDVLTQWAAQGFANYQLIGHVSPAPSNLDAIKQGVAHFGPLYIGANLPVSAQKQPIWQAILDDGGVWGGHCMVVVGYDAISVKLITWGEIQWCTWNWWVKYVDEAHILLLADWLKRYPATPQSEIQSLLQDIR